MSWLTSFAQTKFEGEKEQNNSQNFDIWDFGHIKKYFLK
jgi:hypothetical protein